MNTAYFWRIKGFDNIELLIMALETYLYNLEID